MGYAASLRGSKHASAAGTGTHNASRGRAAKVEIRRRVLEAIGPERAGVFDAFAGRGEMHREVWHGAARYVGCDLEWHRDKRRVFVADNRAVLRSLDLSAFNIFDLDSFGSPWEQALIVAARRKVAPGETLGLVLTEGSGLKLKMGGVPRALALLCGVPTRVARANRLEDDMIRGAVRGLAGRMGCRVLKEWRAGTDQRSAMRYLGLVLEGQTASGRET